MCERSWRRIASMLVLLLAVVGLPARAEDATVPLADALRALQQRGAPLVFSSEWLRAGQRVDAGIGQRFDARALDAALAPFGLGLRRVGRLWVVVHAGRVAGTSVPQDRSLQGQLIDERGAPVEGARVHVGEVELLTDEQGRFALPASVGSVTVRVDKHGFEVLQRTLAPDAPTPLWVLRRPAAIEEVVVVASRYAFRDGDALSLDMLSAADLAARPALGDDAMRALGRLPGMAGVGLSARPRVRGGDDDEVLLLFDGVELLEPFHLKDFQGIFSSIDGRAIDGVQAFTGAFPVRYGGRLSGVLAFDSLRPGLRRHEVSISPFQAGIVSSGALPEVAELAGVPGADVLLSLRRGNLDLLLDQVNPALGRPEFFDGLLRLGVDLREDGSERVELAYLALGDEIELHNTDLGEDARSDYRSGYLWLRHRRAWTHALVSSTTLGFSDLRNTRTGSVDAPGDVTGSLADRRESHRLALTQDWQLAPDPARLFTFGASLQQLNTDYDFASSATYGVFGQAVQGVGTRQLRVRRAPDGLRMGVHAEGRWRLPAFAAAHLELGVRADRQTDLDDGSATQLGWHAAFSSHLYADTAVRVAAGRYHQPPGTNALRAGDGVLRFAGVQRADQVVLGIERALGDVATLRVEAYGKRQAHVQPRGDNLVNDVVLLPELHYDRVRVDSRRTRAFGVEVGMDGTLGEFAWHGFYALARSEEREDERWRPRAWDQRHSAGGALTTTRWGIDFAVDVAWHSGWPATTFDFREGAAILGVRNGSRYPDYFSLDVRAERAFRWRGLDIDLALQVQNLTARENRGGDRNVLVDGERAHDAEHLLPPTPSLTLRVALPED